MNWTGSINTNVRSRKSKDRQAQKDFFNRQRLLRAQKSYIESNAEMTVNNALTRALHLTTSSQRNNPKNTKHKKLDQRVSDFQKAALLQKCQQINEQDNKLEKSETVDKLLSDASKICGRSTNVVSSNLLSSCIHTPYDPLFDFETATSSTSLSGYVSQAKVSSDTSAIYNQLERDIEHEEGFNAQNGLPHFGGCLAGYESDSHIGLEDDYQLRESIPPTIGPTDWQQWKRSIETRIGNSTNMNDLGSLGTCESSQRFPVSLSVSSLDEGVILASL